jgi:hypothetical protein
MRACLRRSQSCPCNAQEKAFVERCKAGGPYGALNVERFCEMLSPVSAAADRHGLGLRAAVACSGARKNANVLARAHASHGARLRPGPSRQVLERGDYVAQLRHWLQYFPPEQARPPAARSPPAAHTRAKRSKAAAIEWRGPFSDICDVHIGPARSEAAAFHAERLPLPGRLGP